jgi:hypothetical protein
MKPERIALIGFSLYWRTDLIVLPWPASLPPLRLAGVE